MQYVNISICCVTGSYRWNSLVVRRLPSGTTKAEASAWHETSMLDCPEGKIEATCSLSARLLGQCE